jgi:predicted dithiol-disulfide oxidoreductase (DUF899 family)
VTDELLVAGRSLIEESSDEGGDSMGEHKTGTREEWLAARKELLEREKELTRRSDELARRRQELPWVPVEKPYSFETDKGKQTLAELFDGRSQLLVFHFMFGPDDTEGCPGCSYTADHVDGAVVHLNHRDVTFLAASRGPLEKLDAYKRRMGWSLPWVSSGESDFNLDFGLFTEQQRRTGTGYNFGSARRSDLNLLDEELHGLSAFGLEDGVVYHTYSCYDRGTDVLHGTWQLLDRAPKGRGEDFENWPRRHDEYEDPVNADAGAAPPAGRSTR